MMLAIGPARDNNFVMNANALLHVAALALSASWCFAAEKSQVKEPLSDIVQLTSGFARAGEAYFSPDVKWIIFQAAPQGEAHYQMYVAKLKWNLDRIEGIESPDPHQPEEFAQYLRVLLAGWEDAHLRLDGREGEAG